MSGLIQVMDDKRRILSAEIRGQTVDLTDADLPSADGCRHDLKRSPTLSGQLHFYRIRMRITKIDPVNGKR